MAKEERNPVHQNLFTIGDRMRLARKGSDLEIKDVAQRMGLSYVSIYDRENDFTPITRSFLNRFENALGIQEDTLLQNRCNIVPNRPEPPKVTLPTFKHGHKGIGIRSAANQIAEIIEEGIENKIYQDRLPTMRELIQAFGYGRHTIYEALKILKRKNLISTQKKRGTRILKEETDS